DADLRTGDQQHPLDPVEHRRDRTRVVVVQVRSAHAAVDEIGERLRSTGRREHLVRLDVAGEEGLDDESPELAGRGGDEDGHWHVLSWGDPLRSTPAPVSDIPPATRLAALRTRIPSSDQGGSRMAQQADVLVVG